MHLEDLNNLYKDERSDALKKIIIHLTDNVLEDLMTLSSQELQDRELGRRTAEERKIWK